MTPLRPWQLRTPGYRLGQKGPQKAEKVGRRRACIVPAVSRSPQLLPSRRQRADVREDKGGQGPHQPAVIDGLCPPRSSWGGWGTEASPLTFTLPPPCFQVLLLAPKPQGGGPRGQGAGRGAGVGEFYLYSCVLLFYFQKSAALKSPLSMKRARDVITQSAPRGPPD